MLEIVKSWTLYLAAAIEAGAALVIGIAAIESTIGALLLFIRRNSPQIAKENLRLQHGSKTSKFFAAIMDLF